MSELTDAYMKGWSAAWNMATYACERGRKTERQRIVAQLQEYVSDLKACGKKDNFLEIALAIEGQIEEIEREKK